MIITRIILSDNNNIDNDNYMSDETNSNEMIKYSKYSNEDE